MLDFNIPTIGHICCIAELEAIFMLGQAVMDTVLAPNTMIFHESCGMPC